MTLTKEVKQRILDEMQRRRELFAGSDKQFAVSCGINAAQYSRIKNGDTEKVLSESSWLSIARRFNVGLTDAPAWLTAKTLVYEIITEQLTECQDKGLSVMLCDLSDIGKTYTAREYVKHHKQAVYIDCSTAKTKRLLICKIAREFGIESAGNFYEVYANLIYYLKTLTNPLIILDEAGDLEYEAFLEIKALWNETEGYTGWYMLGADGLRAKMERCIEFKKVGYTEIFSRFGRKYVKIVPFGSGEAAKYLQQSAAAIIKANASAGVDERAVLNRTLSDDSIPSLRRIYKELVKEQLNDASEVNQ
jgi:hypothetical protein